MFENFGTNLSWLILGGVVIAGLFTGIGGWGKDFPRSVKIPLQIAVVLIAAATLFL